MASGTIGHQSVGSLHMQNLLGGEPLCVGERAEKPIYESVIVIRLGHGFSRPQLCNSWRDRYTQLFGLLESPKGGEISFLQKKPV